MAGATVACWEQIAKPWGSRSLLRRFRHSCRYFEMPHPLNKTERREQQQLICLASRLSILKLHMSPNIMSEYLHSQLSLPDNVRLLQLLPSKVDPNNIRCELFECALRKSDEVTRPYEALSYFWGGEDKPQSIIIHNQSLKITQNLYTALLRLRDYDIPRIIWVDAVCIDQSNKEEKAQQIPLMVEIYAKASQVIVWLGEEQNDSNRALEAIRVACKSSLDFSKTHQLQKRAISELLQRQWFQRIWVRGQGYTILVDVTKSCSRFCKKLLQLGASRLCVVPWKLMDMLSAWG
jgi:hypothetical protein